MLKGSKFFYLQKCLMIRKLPFSWNKNPKRSEIRQKVKTPSNLRNLQTRLAPKFIKTLYDLKFFLKFQNARRSENDKVAKFKQSEISQKGALGPKMLKVCTKPQELRISSKTSISDHGAEI